jgi:kynurenine formamidase
VTDRLLDAVTAGVRLVELGQPLFTGMPCSPNHPGFRMVLQRRHGDQVRPDGGSAANEVIITGGHVGTHVDALAHVSQDGLLHGGLSAEDVQRSGRMSTLGADWIPPMLSRGVLLNVAAVHGVDVLPAGYGVTEDDLRATGVEVRSGDVVLVRTGWARHFHDPVTYLGHDTGVPGVTEGAARWLASRGVLATGADTTAYERIPPGAGHRVLPVHRIMLVDNGIYLLEHLNLEHAVGLAEFTFVLAPLRIVGATGSPVRPFAVVSA